MSDDPSATYRGYRRQALYVLWRVLTDIDCDTHSYRPEGEEDLAVFDSAGQLVEAVQVKDHVAALGLSHFKPQSPQGFFARMIRRHLDYPKCQHRLASFGPLGEELDRAITSPGTCRDAVAKKLHAANSVISLSDARELLELLNNNVIRLDEAQLHNGVLASVANTIAGIHGESALELLLYWVFDASEHRRIITRYSLLQQLQHIGEYLAVLRDHTIEWMVSVRPLEAKALPTDFTERLRREYRHGVQARWEHILGNCDSPRPQRLSELHDKMSRHSAVVIRGASGQGKSSLAFRYLHDYCVEGLRFHVSFLEGREHALRVANALRGHVEQLRLSVVVLLDLSPSDSGWVELVRDMIDAGLKVLVTVREEDFRRVGSFIPDLDCTELVLDSVTREEAERIYDVLTAGVDAPRTLDFQETWARFTAIDAGPLLEFTHLVTEGQTLAAKLESQVGRLQVEAVTKGVASGFTKEHLKMLTLAAIANAAECRVRFKELCAVAGIDPLTRPLAVLENEYLVREQGAGDETTVDGLHALRSQAVETALIHDCPELWGELAAQCMPLIVDQDLERFFLAAFSRHPEHSATLESAMHKFPLRTWGQAGSIARALLWEGVNRYVAENRKTLEAKVAEHDAAWWLLCDAFVGSDSTFGDNLRQIMTEVLKSEVPRITLTPKTQVFVPLCRWATQAQAPEQAPAKPMDWTMAGDLAFWLGKQKISGTMHRALEKLLPEPLPENLSLADLAQFISGRYQLNDPGFFDWHNRHAAELARRFIHDTNSIYLSDKGGEVKVFFPVIVADSMAGTEPDSTDWHAQTMKRVRLLQQLFPNRSKFSSQGLGMEALGELFPHDPTTKAIPEENLPSERSVRLNALFVNLVHYQFRRAPSWSAYAEAVYGLRRTICDCFRDLHRVWGRILEQSKVTPAVIRQLPAAAIDRIKLLRVPMFPTNAVDEWGYVSEDRENAPNSDGAHNELWGSLGRFKQWRKAWQDYENGAGYVSSRVLLETAQHVALKNRTSNEVSQSGTGGLILNLASAWEALANMQSEFRRWFIRYVPTQKVEELERHERSTFFHLWPVTFAFFTSPLDRLSGGAASLERAMKRRRASFLQHLLTEITNVIAGQGRARVDEGPYTMNGKRSLLVVCDHDTLATIDTSRPQVVLAIWRAARAGGWRQLEWTPLTVEWPHIFVVHLLRGKALFAGGSHLGSKVLFGTEADFQVGRHHIIDLPVSILDFTATGLSVWETPLLTGALGLQSSLLAFTFTMFRYYSVMKLALEHGLLDEQLELYLKSFGREISMLRRDSMRSYDDFVNLLRNFETGSDAQRQIVNNWSTQLKTLYMSRLFLTEGHETLPITIEIFFDWAANLDKSLEEANELFRSIVDLAVSEAVGPR